MMTGGSVSHRPGGAAEPGCVQPGCVQPGCVQPACRDDVVALIPAAGRAQRLPGLVGSKEVVPVRSPGSDESPRPAATHLLSGLAAAGLRRGLVLLRTGKWDVPVALDPVAAELGMALAYLTTPGTASVVHTLDLAWPFVAGARVVVGFPDILLSPRAAFADTLAHQEATGADLVLGCFPTRQPEKTDMVDLAPDGTVRRLVIKQPDCGLRWTWSLAVWTPRFGAFLHAAAAGALPTPVGRELYLGEVIGAVVTAGWRVETVCFPSGSYLDIGTPDDLARAGG